MKDKIKREVSQSLLLFEETETMLRKVLLLGRLLAFEPKSSSDSLPKFPSDFHLFSYSLASGF